MTEELVVAPASILRKKSEEVKKITPKTIKIAEEMVNFLHEHSSDNPMPIGLSACQLGHSIRIIAFRQNPMLKDRNDIIVLINPVLVYGKGQHVVGEGCLNLPGKTYLLKRSKIVKIRGMTLDGSPRSFRGRDTLAQVFQHELEHLDGVLIDSIGVKVK